MQSSSFEPPTEIMMMANFARNEEDANKMIMVMER